MKLLPLWLLLLVATAGRAQTRPVADSSNFIIADSSTNGLVIEHGLVAPRSLFVESPKAIYSPEEVQELLLIQDIRINDLQADVQFLRKRINTIIDLVLTGNRNQREFLLDMQRFLKPRIQIEHILPKKAALVKPVTRTNPTKPVNQKAR